MYINHLKNDLVYLTVYYFFCKETGFLGVLFLYKNIMLLKKKSYRAIILEETNKKQNKKGM